MPADRSRDAGAVAAGQASAEASGSQAQGQREVALAQRDNAVRNGAARRLTVKAPPEWEVALASGAAQGAVVEVHTGRSSCLACSVVPAPGKPATVPTMRPPRAKSLSSMPLVKPSFS